MKKIELYIISLWILFFLIIIKDFVLVSWAFDFSRAGISNFIAVNIPTIVSVFFLLLGLIFYLRFSYMLRGSTSDAYKIVKIEDQNYEHLAFLTTYIIPFLRVKLEGRDLLITIFLLIIIGAIFIKTNLFYKNPTLALLGYKLYKVDTQTKTNLIFISKVDLTKDDNVSILKLYDNVYFVKK